MKIQIIKRKQFSIGRMDARQRSTNESVAIEWYQFFFSLVFDESGDFSFVYIYFQFDKRQKTKEKLTFK